jgi:hypothetical protein
MEQDKRKEKRIKKNLLVYSDNGSFDLLGVSANISKNGVFIEAPQPGSAENEVSIVIAVDNELFKLKGEVQWLKGPGDREPAHIPSGMGIRITEAPAEYLNYVEYLKHTVGSTNLSNNEHSG